ncbi:MAG: hypothetical protein RLZ86_971 [Actinomycetota bacterium]|jgi:hypothetical protein
MASLPPPPPAGDRSGTPRTDARAVAALVCGILGLLILGLVFGAVAVILGRRSRREIMEQPAVLKGLGLATAGMVLGVIDMAAYIFIVFA